MCTQEAIEHIERRIKSVEGLIAGRAQLNGRQQQPGTHAGSEVDIDAELLMLRNSLQEEKEMILKRMSAASAGGAKQEQ